MASSTTNKLTNSYFFYGTHPVKVPNNINHANSTNNISSICDQTTHHLSLQNGSLSISEKVTTKSLLNLPESCTNDDEISEVFEDARGSFHDDDDDDDGNKNPRHRRSSAKQHEELTINLPQVFIECQQINRLFLQNHLNEALQRTTAEENRSFYHSLCHSIINFMQAGMTFNHDDIEAAIQALRHTSTMAKKHEPYKPWIPFSLSHKPALNEYELHAKLVHAEALLIRAILTFIQDQGLLSFISGALKIKECHDIFLKLAKQNDPSRFSSSASYEHFDSGVRMGNGTFNLMISNLPQRVIKYLEFAGFSGDRDIGLSELEKSATSNGLRASFSALSLLSYHTFVTHVFGNADGDLELCHLLVERFLKLYPNSYLFLFFRARLQVLHCRLSEAINTYEYAIHCQNDWKHLHHIAHWEILWCHVLQQEWGKACAMAKTLFDENNWSKATYCYLLATFIFEDNQRITTDEVIQLYKRVPGLKIRLAGKSIPLEKYAIRQCEHFFAQRWLFLPALELVYLLNGFYILAHDPQKLNDTLDIVNKALNDLELHHQNDQFYVDSYGSGLLLRGVLLHFLHRYDEAHQSLDGIIHMAKQFDEKSFLAPNAVLEKGMIYLGLKQKQKAMEYLQKSLSDYKDYQLESRLQFRINAAMQTVKRMNN